MGALEEALASAGALAPGQKAEDVLVVTGGTCVGAKGTWAVRKHSARPLRTVLREARCPARQVSLHVHLCIWEQPGQRLWASRTPTSGGTSPCLSPRGLMGGEEC